MAREITNIIVTPIFHKVKGIKKHSGYRDSGFAYATLLDSDGRSVYHGMVASGHNNYPDPTKMHVSYDQGLDELPIIVDPTALADHATGTYRGMISPS